MKLNVHSDNAKVISGVVGSFQAVLGNWQLVKDFFKMNSSKLSCYLTSQNA